MPVRTLPSSLREKKRYVIFQIHGDRNCTLGEVVGSFWDSMLDLLGQKGTAEADPWVLKELFDEEAQVGGVKVNKDMVEEVRAALALVTEIEGREVAVQVLGVTGTMDSAREKYLE